MIGKVGKQPFRLKQGLPNALRDGSLHALLKNLWQ
jgi:hypothetical protein